MTVPIVAVVVWSLPILFREWWQIYVQLLTFRKKPHIWCSCREWSTAFALDGVVITCRWKTLTPWWVSFCTLCLIPHLYVGLQWWIWGLAMFITPQLLSIVSLSVVLYIPYQWLILMGTGHLCREWRVTVSLQNFMAQYFREFWGLSTDHKTVPLKILEFWAT